MVEETELNTFMAKFKQLWRSGLDAQLDIDSSNGKAWVGLRLRLGDAPGPVRHPYGDPQGKVQEKT